LADNDLRSSIRQVYVSGLLPDAARASHGAKAFVEVVG
jgi:hypothetical protein